MSLRRRQHKDDPEVARDISSRSPSPDDVHRGRASTSALLPRKSLSSADNSVASSIQTVRDALAALPIVFLTVVALSAFTRFYIIAEPNGVVFDEVHFGGFVQQYETGRYFFDIHPPMAKIIMTWMGQALGYDGSKCDYTDTNALYAPDCEYYKLRIVAAFWGFLHPIVVYLVARGLGCSKLASAFASCLLMLDVYHVLEARSILTDSQLNLHCSLAFLVAIHWWKSLNYYTTSSTPMPTRTRVLWVLAVGLSCGASVSVKWTGLATPGMIAVESFFAVMILKASVPFADLLGVAGVVVAEYLFWWKLHFMMLPLSGPGDGYAPLEFQKTLVGSPHYDPSASQSFLYDTFRLNKDMLLGSASINTPHQWESKYYQWILNKRGVLYWGGPFGPQPGLWRAQYLIGNPLCVWGVLGALCLFLVVACLYLRYRSVDPSLTEKYGGTMGRCTYCLLAWFFNLAPYAAVTRQAFAYHYMPALFYGYILWAVLLDRIPAGMWHKAVFLIQIVAVSTMFLFFSPWVYALPLTPEGHEARRFLPTWN